VAADNPWRRPSVAHSAVASHTQHYVRRGDLVPRPVRPHHRRADKVGKSGTDLVRSLLVRRVQIEALQIELDPPPGPFSRAIHRVSAYSSTPELGARHPSTPGAGPSHMSSPGETSTREAWMCLCCLSSWRISISLRSPSAGSRGRKTAEAGLEAVPCLARSPSPSNVLVTGPNRVATCSKGQCGKGDRVAAVRLCAVRFMGLKRMTRKQPDRQHSRNAHPLVQSLLLLLLGPLFTLQSLRPALPIARSTLSCSTTQRPSQHTTYCQYGAAKEE